MLDLDGLDGVLVGPDRTALPPVSPAALLPEGLAAPEVASPPPAPAVDLEPEAQNGGAGKLGWGLVVSAVLLGLGGLGWLAMSEAPVPSGAGVEAPEGVSAAVTAPIRSEPVRPGPTPEPEAVPPPPDAPAVAVARPQTWTVYFDHDVWQTADRLPAIARQAARCSGTFEVVGFGCSLGSRRDRRLIALARAESVATALLDAGVSRTSVTWSAAPLDAPSPHPNTWTGRRKMRRVEVTCTPHHP